MEPNNFNNEFQNNTNTPDLPTLSPEFQQNNIEQQVVQPQVQPMTSVESIKHENNQNMNQIPVPDINTIEPKITNGEPDENNTASGKLIPMIIVSAFVILGLLYATININELAFFAIPGYIVLFSIIFAFIDKKKSDFPLSLLIGGMIGAVITFLLSMNNTEKMDLYTHYSIFSAGFGILGLIIGNMITKLIGDKKNVAALQTIGIVLVIIAFIGGPYYLYKNKPDIMYRYVFYRIDEIKASTEDEFVIKQLENRYNEKFTCNNIKYGLDENKIKVTTRTCRDSKNKEISVKSITYNETEVQYIIEDNYMDVLLIDQFKEDIGGKIAKETTGSVAVSIYPEKNCNFVGDCIDCKEYLEDYEELTNIDNKYNNSKELKLEKYKTMTPVNFINDYGFKIRIEISGLFNNLPIQTYENMIESTLNTLNTQGVKNTYGYEIIIYYYDSSSQLKYAVYKVEGQKNSDQTFKDPTVLEV